MPARPALGNANDGMVRIGGLAAVPTVLRELGVDPAPMLAEMGLDLALFDDRDALIPFATRGRIFQHCVAKTGCSHFGLLVGQHTDSSNFGLIGLLTRYSPDVHTALRNLVGHLHLHVRGAVAGLSVVGGWAELRYEIHQPRCEATDQLGDGAVAAMFNIVRDLCHPAWKPAQVLLAHRRPANVLPYRQFFQAPLEFDADRYALVFTADWLDRPLPSDDPALRQLLQQRVDALQAQHGGSFADQVRSVLRTALMTGHGQADQVAALFSMHSRTLSRRLIAEGISFHALVDECGCELSRQLLLLSNQDIPQIASSLGYADASAFTRAFRRWTGSTPARWRLQHRAEASAAASPVAKPPPGRGRRRAGAAHARVVAHP